MPTLKEWENKKVILAEKLTAALGLKRLSPSFSAHREAYHEIDDPTVGHCETIWTEWQKRRLPPERRIGEAFTAERVSFPGIDGEPAIVGVLRTPKNLTKPVTAVLCLHGHARGLVIGKEITEFYAVPFAESGLITFAPDSLRFGERRIKEFDQLEIKHGGQTLFQGERMLIQKFFLKGESYVGNQIAEFMRCVDFLRSLPNVERIVVMGHSMGGLIATWLGALDGRVDATICLAGLPCYEAMAKRDTARYHGMYTVVPGLLNACGTSDIVSLIAPRKFYAVHAMKDLGFPIDEVKRITSEAAAVFDLYGVRDNLNSKVVEGDHGDMLGKDALDEILDYIKAVQ